MRGAGPNQGTNFVAEFAAKRAAQLERARQLREERKKPTTPEASERPPSGSPMTYARNPQPQEESVGHRPTSASIRQHQHQDQFAATYSQHPDRRAQPNGNSTSSSAPQSARYADSVPSEVVVTEDDFRRAMKQGIITPDQARQLWGVLSDPTSDARLGSFKRAQPQATPAYDPSRYDADRLDESHNNRPYGGLETKKPASKKPEWNYDLTSPSEDPYPPQSAPSRKVPGGTYSVRQTQEWNSDPTPSYDEPPPPSRTVAKKPAAKPTIGRQLPAWNDDFVDNGIPDAPPPVKQRMPAKQPMRRPQEDVYDAPPARTIAKQPPVVASLNRNPANSRAPPPPPPPQEVDEDELEEFQRLKEEQARQFEEALQEAEDGSRLVPCRLCGRTFRETIIQRHEQACAKANKKRKTFDMTKARLEGIEGAEEVLRAKKRQAKNPPPVEKPAGKMPKWKLQHEQFQAVLKMNKGGPGALSGPPIPMPEELDDRVPCPHCGRKFASDTAERHIPKCATTVNKPKSLARPIRR